MNSSSTSSCGSGRTANALKKLVEALRSAVEKPHDTSAPNWNANKSFPWKSFICNTKFSPEPKGRTSSTFERSMIAEELSGAECGRDEADAPPEEVFMLPASEEGRTSALILARGRV